MVEPVLRTFTYAILGLGAAALAAFLGYDPFTTREFYSMSAFFADVKETIVGAQEPTRFPNPEQAVRNAIAMTDMAAETDRAGQIRGVLSLPKRPDERSARRVARNR